MDIAGVDGCRAGWLVVTAAVEGRLVLREEPRIVADFDALLALTGACAAVAVDMPIGLSADGPRRADYEARRLLGRPRASSVFPAPVRGILDATAYRAACEASFAACGKRLSQQTFNILAKVGEADAAMTPALQAWVVEGHPEVSFQALNLGRPMMHSKKGAAGRAERRALLERAFDGPLPATAPAGAALDDLYDALVLAWTAARLARGAAARLPAAPERDGRGLHMEIVY